MSVKERPAGGCATQGTVPVSTFSVNMTRPLSNFAFNLPAPQGVHVGFIWPTGPGWKKQPNSRLLQSQINERPSPPPAPLDRQTFNDADDEILSATQNVYNQGSSTEDTIYNLGNIQGSFHF